MSFFLLLNTKFILVVSKQLMISTDFHSMEINGYWLPTNFKTSSQQKTESHTDLEQQMTTEVNNVRTERKYLDVPSL